jgi:hypothetical protein
MSESPKSRRRRQKDLFGRKLAEIDLLKAENAALRKLASRPSPSEEALEKAIEAVWACRICVQPSVRFRPHDGTCRVNATPLQGLRHFLAERYAALAAPSDPKEGA